jgi:hypothetical protein
VLWSRDVDGVGEDPEGLAAPSGEAGLAEIGFGAILTGAGQRQIEDVSFAAGDLATVSQYADCRSIRTCGQGDVENRIVGPRDRLSRTGGIGWRHDALRKAVGGIEGIDCAEGVTVLEGREQGVDAGLAIVGGALGVEENVLPDQAEDRKITGETGELMIVDAE